MEGSKYISPAQMSGTGCGGLERRPGGGVYVEEAWGGKRGLGGLERMRKSLVLPLHLESDNMARIWTGGGMGPIQVFGFEPVRYTGNTCMGIGKCFHHTRTVYILSR